MITNRADINSLLSQMQTLKSQAMGNAEFQPRSDVEAALRTSGDPVKVSESNKVPNFSTMFSNAINSVNDTQQTASALSTAYQQGDQGITLSQVMVASQKASVSFQAVTQVRNKLVEAYKDVMSMPL